MKRIYLSMAALLISSMTWAQFSGGQGTEDNPYRITKEEDFAELADSVNESGCSFEGKFFRLENDLTFQNEITPIGKYVSYSEVSKFNGTFDGNSHTLTNMKYTVKAATERYASLFGTIDEQGTVKNLNFASPEIIQNQGTLCNGGIVASQLYGVVDNVHVTGGVISSTTGSQKGGLVGQLYNSGSILNSSFSGSITATTTIGGITGQNYGVIRNCWSDATLTLLTESTSVYAAGIAAVTTKLNGSVPLEITDCYFLGTINGASGIVGGINGNLREARMERCWNGGYIQANGNTGGLVGQMQGGTEMAVISDCYNAGTVYNVRSSSVGGIVGQVQGTADKSELTNCLNYGSVFNSILARTDNCEYVGTNNVSYTLSNCHFDQQVSGWGGTIGGLTTRQLTDGTALEGYSTDVWTFAEGMYPRLNNTKDQDFAILFATPFYLAEGEVHNKVRSSFTVSTANDVEWDVTGSPLAKISGSTVTVTRGDKVAEPVLHAYLGDYEKRALIIIDPVIFEGDGTEDSPYVIATYDDLKKLAAATSTDGMVFAGEYFKMTADIDMQNDSSFELISNNSDNAFSGIFDGDGHSIKNWTIDNRAQQKLWTGLFGFIGKQGVVKNLCIDRSCSLHFFRNAGAVAAVLYGTLDNCRNYADLHTQNGFAGGLVYCAYNDAVIKNCYNEGNVVSDEVNGNMGGIVYSADAGVAIENTQNAGDVVAALKSQSGTQANNVGGIAGSARGTLVNVLNTGRVVSNERVGGIAGQVYATTIIKDALSLGAVVYDGASDYAGAVAGFYTSGTTYERVVFDAQLAIYNNVVDAGITAKSTAAIIADGFGDEAFWHQSEGRYPTLKSFAHEAGAMLGSYAVLFGADDTRASVTTDVVLPVADGLTWTVGGGSCFTVEGNVLKFTEPESATTDILTGSYASLTKTVPLAAMPNLLPGKGTEDDPWLIASPADLVKISATVAENKNGLSGKVFSVTEHLDMADAGFEPIAADGTTKFGGIIHGHGKEISNLHLDKGGADYVALIGILGKEGAIDSLVVKSGTVSGKQYVGAFAGCAEGSITHCVSHADVTGSAYVGGIAGALKGGTLSSVHNFGSVSGSATANNYGVGGIAGQVSDGGMVVGALNDGDVSGYGPAAGIAGMTTISAAAPVNIKGCRNAGHITSANNSAAGIVANGGSTANALFIDGCANTGDVETTRTTAIGTYSSDGFAGIVATGNPVITGCWNAGHIKAPDHVGGLLGWPASSYSAVTIKNCVNTGYVEATAENAAGAGAIAGSLPISTYSSYFTGESIYNDRQLCPVDAVKSGAITSDAIFEKNTTELVTAPLGEDWSAGEGRLPVPAVLADDEATLIAAMPVFLADGDTRLKVTKAFTVATAEAYMWTMDEPFTLTGNRVDIAADTKGDYLFTVAKDSYSFVYTLSIDCQTATGIATVAAGESDGRFWVYTANGKLVMSGSDFSGQVLGRGVYIVKTAKGTRKLVVE